MLYRGQGLLTRGFLVGQDVEAGDDPALHLVKDDLPPELHCGAPLSPFDDPRVGFEQAEHFLRRGHRRPIEHAPLGLLDALPHQREEAVALCREAVKRRVQRAGCGQGLGWCVAVRSSPARKASRTRSAWRGVWRVTASRRW